MVFCKLSVPPLLSMPPPLAAWLLGHGGVGQRQIAAGLVVDGTARRGSVVEKGAVARGHRSAAVFDRAAGFVALHRIAGKGAVGDRHRAGVVVDAAAVAVIDPVAGDSGVIQRQRAGIVFDRTARFGRAIVGQSVAREGNGAGFVFQNPAIGGIIAGEEAAGDRGRGGKAGDGAAGIRRRSCLRRSSC